MTIYFIATLNGESLNDAGPYKPSIYTLYGDVKHERKPKYVTTLTDINTEHVVKLWTNKPTFQVGVPGTTIIDQLQAQNVNPALVNTIQVILNGEYSISSPKVRAGSKFGSVDMPLAPVNKITGQVVTKHYRMLLKHIPALTLRDSDIPVLTRIFKSSPTANNSPLVQRLIEAQQDADGDVKNII